MATVEILIGDPPCSGCEQIAVLAQRMSDKYGIKWILKYTKGKK